jgi:hypothetical protein
MSPRVRKRDSRFTRTVGQKPARGRRYVENGKVKIEWFEEGKRRSRTVGRNAPDMRDEADRLLHAQLGLAFQQVGRESPPPPKVQSESVAAAARAAALAIIDLADALADRMRDALLGSANRERRP